MTQLETIKILLGESANLFSDNQLNAYIDQSQDEFIIYCNCLEVPNVAKNLINQMVVVKCNRIGTEGLESQSFSGISDNFLDGYPANIINQLKRFRKVKFL